MVNRFLSLIEARQSISNELNDKSKKLTHLRTAHLISGFKKLTWKIAHFGSTEKIIRIVAQYYEDPEEKETIRLSEFYFSGVEPFEALECVRYRLRDKFIEATAYEIPAGKPIKI